MVERDLPKVEHGFDSRHPLFDGKSLCILGTTVWLYNGYRVGMIGYVVPKSLVHTVLFVLKK